MPWPHRSNRGSEAVPTQLPPPRAQLTKESEWGLHNTTMPPVFQTGSGKEAILGEDKSGLTSRADGLRNPILEVILEGLTYNTIYLSPFLLEISSLSILTTSSSRMCNPGIRVVRACKYCSLVSSCSLGAVMAAPVARGARSSGDRKRTSDSGSLLSCSF